MTLRVRWLGRVRYRDGEALQRALHAGVGGNYLLLLEHPHVFTLGLRGRMEHVLGDAAALGAELVRTNRGGDVTYHGPGQLVGYPIVDVAPGPGSVPAYVHGVEQVVIEALADVGLTATGRLEGYPGVWVDPAGPTPRKICAVGVRVTRGRTMHGFALNVDPDLTYFERIVPCGLAGKATTSLAAEGIDATMSDVVNAVVARAGQMWGTGVVDRHDVAWHVRPDDLSLFSRRESPGGAPVRLLGRLAAAGVDPGEAVDLSERKPPWLRVPADMGPRYRDLRRTMRSLDLVTVCEEAGCPNIFDCWNAGTATFMINGDRCTRACGFCLVDTRRPRPPDRGEPAHVAAAVAKMDLSHAVVTAVARDDLPDGGAAQFIATIEAVRAQCPRTAVEVLIPDCKGDPAALEAIFAARPDVLNHNVETVVRLQRAVRPSASYARSLAVLARAKAAGLTTKSGLMVGLGEHVDEVLATMADLHAVGVDIVTIGQYLRPTAAHLPVARWWTPDEFEQLRIAGEEMGLAHVQSSPLTRSSYHAGEALERAVPADLVKTS